jgi:UDP-N-acetylmuramate--alanine ligase
VRLKHQHQTLVWPAAARGGWPDKRLVLVFQPHRFTRTRDQFDAFARVLAEPDVLILADIYPAGEAPIPGIDSQALAEAITQRGDDRVRRIHSVDEAPACIDRVCQDGDLLLIMGAGDVGRLAQTLKRSLA